MNANQHDNHTAFAATAAAGVVRPANQGWFTVERNEDPGIMPLETLV